MGESRQRFARTKARIGRKAESILRLVTILMWFAASAQQYIQAQPSFEWVGQGILPGCCSAGPLALAVDGMTNIFVTGSYRRVAAFGTNVFDLLQDTEAMFLVKFGSTGNVAWARSAGSAGIPNGYSRGASVAVDASGNVYVTGPSSPQVAIGSTVLVPSSGASPNLSFVAKYDNAGVVLWAIKLETAGVNSFVAGSGLAVDTHGNIHVIGFFSGTGNFGGSLLSSGDGSDADLFHVTFDPSGKVIWARRAGSISRGLNFGEPLRISTDTNGNTYLLGGYYNLLVMGNFLLPGPGTFLGKYDRNGEVIWAQRVIQTNCCYSAAALATDRGGSAFIAGYFQTALSIGGTNLLAPSVGSYTFLAKFSTNGDTLGVNITGGTNVYPHGIAVDAAGNSYVAGTFSGSAIFGSATLTSTGSYDIFVAKYDIMGNIVYARGAGGFFDDYAVGVDLDPGGNVYTTGIFRDPATFDTIIVHGSGGADLFLAKISSSVLSPPIISLQPQNLNLAAGTDAAFNVTATGTAPLSYDWRFNGVSLLPRATNSLLIISNVQPANAGNWTVVVTNAYGSATSQVATLTVAVPTFITLIDITKQVWKYNASGIDLGTSWSEASFNDNSWLSGMALFGYESTPLVYPYPFFSIVEPPQLGGPITAYYRTHFQWSGSRSNTTLIATNFVDDGAVFYLNGSEVGRLRVPLGQTFSTLASSAQPSEGAAEVLTFDSGVLVSGDNVMCVEIHQSDPASSDDVFGMLLTAVSTLIPPTPTVLNLFTNGTGSISKSPDKASYSVDEHVTLTATPGRWYAFTRWSDGITNNPRVITIGANNNYTAIFSPTTAVETLTFSNVSRTAPVGMPAIFVDGEFVVSNAVTRLESAQVSIATTFPNGALFFTLDGSEPSFMSSLYGVPFTLRRSTVVRAIAYDASFLSSWESDPAQLFIRPVYSVSARTDGGGTVTISPAGASYPSNTVITLNAVSAPGWTFLQWLGDVTGSNPTNSLHLTRDLCVEAMFGTTLGTTVTGSGAILRDPDAALYPFGTVARLTGSPQAGNYFAVWGNAASSTNNPLLFTLTNANPIVSSLFAPLNAGQSALTVIANGWGRVIASPRGNRFNSSQGVTLTAIPDADQSFLGWSGNANGAQTNLFVVMNQSKIISANFTRNPRLSLGPCLGGERENGFQLTLTGDFGAHYEIDGSTDFVHWMTVQTLTNQYGRAQWTDPAGTNGFHFYRALQAP